MKTQNYKKIFLYTALFIGVTVVFSGVFVSAQVSDRKYQEALVLTDSEKVELKQKIKIPEIIYATSTVPDYSRVDLDSEIKLGSGQSVRVTSKEVLSVLGAPEAVQGIVEDYNTARAHLDKKIFMLPGAREKERGFIDMTFRYLLQKELIAEGLLPQNYFEKKKNGEIYSADSVIDLKGKKISKRKSLEGGVTASRGSVPVITVEKNAKREIITEKKNTGALIIKHAKDLLTSLQDFFVSFIRGAIAWAQGADPIDRATQFLLTNQNPDSSWGSGSTQFITTAQVLSTLNELGMGTSTAATTSASWINFYISDNNDYLAQKIARLSEAGDYVGDLGDTLAMNIDDETGGVSFSRGFEPDPITTARAVNAFREANYQDPGENPTFSLTAALYYLTTTQRFDGGWSPAAGAPSSVLATAEVLEALIPYRTTSITGTQGGEVIVISSITSRAVAFLKDSQNQNGTWENDLIATSRALTALKKAGANPPYREVAISYIEGAQATDGSFQNGNMYATAVALEALFWGNHNAGEIVVNSVVATTTLQTGAPATIQVSVTKIGDDPVLQGTIHVFVDLAHVFEFSIESIGVVFAPNETILFNITFPDTLTFVGDTTFTLFFESGGESVYANGWKETTFLFTPNSNGYPGLPVYFQAFQGVFLNGSPSIIFGWPEKADPNRLQYEAMWRVEGTNDWYTYPISQGGNILAGVFAENTTYEVSFSTISQDGQTRIYFTDPVLVTTSSSYTAYDGTVAGSLLDEGIPLSNERVYIGEVVPTTDANGNYSTNGISNGAHLHGSV